MKIFSFLLICSFALFTMSCSDDAIADVGQTQELELRRHNGGDGGGGNGFTNGYSMRYEIGEWISSEECQRFINAAPVYDTRSDCLCQKNFLRNKYSGANGYCFTLLRDCSPTTRSPNDNCQG